VVEVAAEAFAGWFGEQDDVVVDVQAAVEQVGEFQLGELVDAHGVEGEQGG
jgi:hypothetical protein